MGNAELSRLWNLSLNEDSLTALERIHTPTLQAYLSPVSEEIKAEEETKKKRAEQIKARTVSKDDIKEWEEQDKEAEKYKTKHNKVPDLHGFPGSDIFLKVYTWKARRL